MLTLTTALLSSALLAGPGAGACHCFNDRTYDPARPAAADAYLVATTRSSLLSAAFGPSKRELVQAVMTGTSPDDLFVAHWAARRLGANADALLAAKTARGTWRAVLAGRAELGEGVAAAVARGAGDADLAAIAIDDTLAARAGTDAGAIAAARAAGASSGELILAAVLAIRAGTPPAALVARSRREGVSWGAQLTALGLSPKDLDPLVRQRVR